MPKTAPPPHATRTPVNPNWYTSTVLPVLDALSDLVLGVPDRRACEELYARLFRLADDIHAVLEALHGDAVATEQFPTNFTPDEAA